MKLLFGFLLTALCINTYLNADNFVQTTAPVTNPKVVVKVPPFTSFDKALQQEMKKHPQNSVFFVDGKTGKILSVNKTPKVKSSAPNPGKFYPKNEEKPHQQSKIAPHKMQEERVILQ